MATAFPLTAKTSLYALVACCFQPSHTLEPATEAQYLVFQKQPKRQCYNQPMNGSIPNNQNPPQWVKDDYVEACVECNVEFDLIKRKHHCRCCGFVFCGHCAAHFNRVVKFGFVNPVRLCNNCAAMTTAENVFYEKFLPLLESGDVFSKYGLLRKRYVYLKFLRAKNVIQYQTFDPESKTCMGDIKAIPLDEITDVCEVAPGQDNADVGIIFCSKGSQEQRFDALTAVKKQLWMEAILRARQVRDMMLAKERDERMKQVEKENDEIRKMSKNLQMMEKRRATFQEDRMRSRAVKREQLRAKYQLAASVS